MGKCASAIGIGLTGAIAGAVAYGMMVPREHCPVRRKVKDAAEEVQDMAGHIVEEL